MNLIERIELMAYNADSYRCMLTNGKVDEKHAAADREAIETVRAMQEALDSIRKDCRRGAHELGMTDAGVRDIARRCDEALRRAEGNEG